MTKQIKIHATKNIRYNEQCRIVDEYINQYNEKGIPLITEENTNHQIYLATHRYHVSCHETKTMFVFNIWRLND